MFVQHSVHIGRPIETVTAVLASGPREWFARLDDSGEAAVGPNVAGVGLRKKVAVEIGQPVSLGDWIEIPITWKATFVEQLFPVMVGKIQLSPAVAQTTRLTVCGMYEAPLGPVGRQLDHAFMHTVADATIKDLAELLAKQFEAAASA
jgi:hypothetical protein